MKLVNKDSDYAVRGLFSLGLNREGPMSSRDIANGQGIPLQYIRRILQTLVREGYVVSKEGKGGALKRLGKNILMKEYVISIDGHIV